MFLISQEVLAQQLFNDGAALLNETKRYAFFSFVIMTGLNMTYSANLHGPHLLCTTYCYLPSTGTCTVVLLDKTAIPQLQPNGNYMGEKKNLFLSLK